MKKKVKENFSNFTTLNKICEITLLINLTIFNELDINNNYM